MARLLSSLTLENFKAFGRRTTIPLAPITVLVGENSAGKSSVIQSLLFLKQTLAHTQTGQEQLLPRGSLVDLGSIQELLFGHDGDRTCEIAPVLARVPGGISFFHDFFEEEPKRNLPFLQDLAAASSTQSDTERLGLGVRFGCSASRGDSALEMRDFRLYWHFEGDERPLALLGVLPGDTRQVQEITRDHPAVLLVSRWFEAVRQDIAEALKAWPDTQEFSDWECYSYEHADWSGAIQFIDHIIAQHGQDYLDEFVAWLDAFTAGDYFAQVERRGKHQLLQLQGFLPQPSRLARGINWDSLEPCEPDDDDPVYAPESRAPWLSKSWVDEESEAERSKSKPAFTDLLNRLIDLRANYESGWEDRKRETLPLDDSFFNAVKVALDTGRALGDVLDGLAYLGPLREYPARQYLYEGVRWPDVGTSGGNLPSLLLENEELREEINETLRIFQADYQLTVAQSDDPGFEGVFAVRLIDAQTKIPVSLLDVGFGVGQVLPIIAQCLRSRNQVILVEQPEIHLHPRLQAELGSLFAKSAGEPYSNQIIVETHSEYLIYRLQKLIRKGQLKPEDVSVLYFLKDDDGTLCFPLRLDEEGRFLDPWPKGFFEEGYKELFD